MKEQVCEIITRRTRARVRVVCIAHVLHVIFNEG